jgi:hypothetical protein
VVYRGVERETYSCTPVCSPRPTLGDALFKPEIDDITARNSAAAGGTGGR